MLDRPDFDTTFYKNMKGAEANIRDRRFKPETGLIFVIVHRTNISYELRMSEDLEN